MLNNDDQGCAVSGCDGIPKVLLNFSEVGGEFYFCIDHFERAFLIQDTDNEKEHLEKFTGRSL